MECRVTEKNEWGSWVTPSLSRDKPIHRWYLFPHSFSDNLVHALIGEWELDTEDLILDPFAGSGTTLLAAKEKGISGHGFDLSPLAVLASKTKTHTFYKQSLEQAWELLKSQLARTNGNNGALDYPELVRNALPEGRLEALDALSQGIAEIDCRTQERDFFQLALMSIIPQFSYAVANGGWLRWQNDGADAQEVSMVFEGQVTAMIADLEVATSPKPGTWETRIADARSLPVPDDTYSAVITSPPYPNRHDYTRIFGVELMFAFHDWERNRSLRYQTLHSHPEARPRRPQASQYTAPSGLAERVAKLSDKRIQRMLEGYFLDMYLCLREIMRVCKQGAKSALVVGNVQYDGQAFPVDEFTAEIGEEVGLRCKEIRAVRWRGNSAQQMGKYGRTKSRESVVIFAK